MSSRLAIDGGNPIRTTPFPAWPVFDQLEETAILEVLHSGQWGVLAGTKVKQFEADFAAFQQASHGSCVVNGTAGLEVAIRAMGIGPGDEVLTTPYTFIATTNAILLAGAIPVFVDIDPNTFLMDVNQIEASIGPRTRAIMPVHLAGCPIDLDTVIDIARRHQLAVIEDACQAWGAEWKGQRVGAIGDVGVFSFQASKNITAGEGGIIVTNNEDVADMVWSLHNVGRTRTGKWYEHVRVGWNCRMTEWQGAILLAQLSRLPAQLRLRTQNALYLRERLAEIPGIGLLQIAPAITQHAWHIFIFRYDSTAFGGMSRDAFIETLQAEGIPCMPGYLPLNRSQAVMEALEQLVRTPEDCPVNERLCTDEAVWLPQTVLLGTQSDMDTIVGAIAKIQSAKG